MTRRLVALLLSAFGAFARADEASQQAEVKGQAAAAFRFGDFVQLDKLHREYQSGGARTPAGVIKLDLFRGGLEWVFRGPAGATERYFIELERLTLQWANEEPRSALAHILHAQALHSHAYFFRGTGLANTVPPDAWADFRRYSTLAADYMAKHADVVLADSSGHMLLITIGRSLGWSVDRVMAIAKDGLTKNPQDDDLRFNMLTTLLPKWQGNAVVLDRYINEVTEATRAERGLEFYARLYAAAASEHFEHALFEQSAADWPKMKAGFEDLLRRYPDAYTVNRLAYFACLARDKPVLLDRLEQIGRQPVLSRWGRNPDRTFESCQRWARSQ
jgi:hypothetical protein